MIKSPSPKLSSLCCEPRSLKQHSRQIVQQYDHLNRGSLLCGLLMTFSVVKNNCPRFCCCHNIIHCQLCYYEHLFQNGPFFVGNTLCEFLKICGDICLDLCTLTSLDEPNMWSERLEIRRELDIAIKMITSSKYFQWHL